MQPLDRMAPRWQPELKNQDILGGKHADPTSTFAKAKFFKNPTRNMGTLGSVFGRVVFSKFPVGRMMLSFSWEPQGSNLIGHDWSFLAIVSRALPQIFKVKGWICTGSSWSKTLGFSHNRGPLSFVTLGYSLHPMSVTQLPRCFPKRVFP